VNVFAVLLMTWLLSLVAPPYGYGHTADVERGALAVWGQYARCEETMKYRSCFDALSNAARRGWSQQRGVTNSSEYEREKLRNDYADLRLTLLQANRSDASVILRVLASGLNEGRPFSTYQEYILVRAEGRWKIDRVQVHGKAELP
jgi:hypothetical protein